MIGKMRLTRASFRLPVLIFLVATLLGLIFFFQAYLWNLPAKPDQRSPWQDLLFIEVVAFYLYAVLSVFVFKLARRYPLHQYSWKRLALVHGSAALVFAAIHLFAHAYLASASSMYGKWTFREFVVENHIICTYRILWRMMLYFAILSVWYAVDFHRRSRAAEAKALQLETELKHAKLEGLKNQLSPDLLFETLQDVAAMILKDVERADRLIARLGSFLRSCLESAGKPVVPVSQEISLLVAYGEIQKIRLENELDMQIELDPEINDLIIPNLFLFQLVESLILKSSVPSKNSIVIRLTRKNDLLQIQVVREAHVSSQMDRAGAERCWKETQLRIDRLYGSIGKMGTILEPNGRIVLNMEIPVEEEPGIEMHAKSMDRQGLSLDEYRRSIEPEHSLANRWFYQRGIRPAFIFAIWTLLAVYFQAREFHNAKIAIMWKQLFLSFLPWYIWAFATPVVLLLHRRYPLNHSSWVRNIPIHLGACLAIWFVVTLGNTTIWAFLESVNFYTMLGQSLLYSRIAINSLVYSTVVAVAIAAAYYGKYRQGELRGSKLQIKIMEAQLQAIQMQLQPHFLFNTLNSISELMHENVQAAEQMLKRLEDFLRLTLRNDARQELTLREEMEFLRGYLEIQQMRFQDRLKVEMRIDDGVLEHLVPSLLCQPIIENAIRHGISPLLKEGRIEIIAERENGMLRLQIKDNGPGLPPAGHWKEGFGLSNTRAMLLQLYGERHEFRLQNSSEGGLIVTFKIPAMIPKPEDLT